MSPARIATARLELVPGNRELSKAELSDHARFAFLLNARVTQWPPPLNDEKSMRFALNYYSRNPDANGWGVWYFILTMKGQERIAIGNGGFKGKPTPDGTAEVGYSILENYQGHGYATEALRGMLTWAFRRAAVRRVIAETLPELNSSIRVLEKNGFRAIDGGAGHGVVRYELLRETLQS